MKRIAISMFMTVLVIQYAKGQIPEEIFDNLTFHPPAKVVKASANYKGFVVNSIQLDNGDMVIYDMPEDEYESHAFRRISSEGSEVWSFPIRKIIETNEPPIEEYFSPWTGLWYGFEIFPMIPTGGNILAMYLDKEYADEDSIVYYAVALSIADGSEVKRREIFRTQNYMEHGIYPAQYMMTPDSALCAMWHVDYGPLVDEDPNTKDPILRVRVFDSALEEMYSTEFSLPIFQDMEFDDIDDLDDLHEPILKSWINDAGDIFFVRTLPSLPEEDRDARLLQYYERSTGKQHKVRIAQQTGEYKSSEYHWRDQYYLSNTWFIPHPDTNKVIITTCFKNQNKFVGAYLTNIDISEAEIKHQNIITITPEEGDSLVDDDELKGFNIQETFYFASTGEVVLYAPAISFGISDSQLKLYNDGTTSTGYFEFFLIGCTPQGDRTWLAGFIPERFTKYQSGHPSPYFLSASEKEISLIYTDKMNKAERDFYIKSFNVPERKWGEMRKIATNTSKKEWLIPMYWSQGSFVFSHCVGSYFSRADTRALWVEFD